MKRISDGLMRDYISSFKLFHVSIRTGANITRQFIGRYLEE
jgi:hypothetical protein